MTQSSSTIQDAPDKPGTLPGRWRVGHRTAYAPQIAADRETGLPDDIDGLTTAAKISVIGLFVVALGAIAYLTQAVVVPVILSWVVATILLPVVSRLEDAGLPRTLAAILATVTLLAVIGMLLLLLSVPLTYWMGRATEIGALVRDKLQSVSQPLALFEEIGKSLGQLTGSKGAISVTSSSNIVTGILGILTPAVSQFILFFGALAFYLIYQQEIRTGAVVFLRRREARLVALRILNDVESNMTVYFGTFTIVNLCLGVVTVGLTYAVGLPNPLLWGVLAAVLNYIPYIGVAIVTGTLFAVGMLTFPTLGEAAVAPAIYVAITTIEGHFLTPTVIGHRLTMNPFLVFLSIAFWTWLWGPIGAFLAVPIVMVAIVAMRHLFPEDKPDLPA